MTDRPKVNWRSADYVQPDGTPPILSSTDKIVPADYKPKKTDASWLAPGATKV